MYLTYWRFGLTVIRQSTTKIPCKATNLNLSFKSRMSEVPQTFVNLCPIVKSQTRFSQISRPEGWGIVAFDVIRSPHLDD